MIEVVVFWVVLVVLIFEVWFVVVVRRFCVLVGLVLLILSKLIFLFVRCK